MLRWLLLSAPLEISSLLSLGFEVVKMCVNLNDQLAREPYTPSPQPVALIARKLARNREEVETRKIGRNETWTFQELFPGCTEVDEKPGKKHDIIVSFLIELELIQTQMTQKPMLRAEVYARALRASQNRKEDSL